MANATPFQQNAAKTYILDGSRPLEAWYAAKDPETIFVDTGKEIITVKRIIDDYIKMIPWAEMSPAMREEAQGIISPQLVPASSHKEDQSAEKVDGLHEEHKHASAPPYKPTTIYDPAPSWEEWWGINRTKKGILPGFFNGCGILFFLLSIWVGLASNNVLLSLVCPLVGAFVWFILGGISSLIRSLRTIETYEANIYKQLRGLNQSK